MDVLINVDAGSGADDAETAALTHRLLDELVEHDLDPVVPSSDAPPGAKGIGSEAGSTILVLAASGGVVTTLLGVLQTWLTRNAGSQIVVEVAGDRLELTGATDEERRRALGVWLARHEVAGGDTSAT